MTRSLSPAPLGASEMWQEEVDVKTIQDEVAALGKLITNDYKDLEPVHCVCILNGAAIFCADLIRQIILPIELSFIKVSSYRDSESPQELIIDLTSLGIIEDRHVLVIDDIYDTGNTMNRVVDLLQHRSVKSIKTCALLVKPNENREESPNYHCITVKDDRFYVGYGMDYKGIGRNFPHIVSKKRTTNGKHNFRVSFK